MKDPKTGQFFRLKETESYILEQLDGSASLEDIRQRVEREFHAPLDAEGLQQFVTSLSRLGLLDKEPSDAGHLSLRDRPARWRLFNIRLKLFDPDRLFNLLIPRTRILFTPQFLLLSAVVILVAVSVTIDNWDEIGRDLVRLHRLATLPLVLLSILVIGTCHEFAHGLTCKRFGGEVHEVGFMLIYFCPAFYCNVSDAWLFPERSKRLWVTFAGPYFELFIWALATLAWRLTAPDTGLNFAALVVMTMSGIRTLVNFTPLIKLDGYYLLTDLLEAPNLRTLSFQYVGAGIRRTLGGSAEDVAESTTLRERRIYLIYGLIAATYTFGLLFFIGDKYGRVLVRNYGGWGVALFGLLAVAKVQSRFRRLLPEPSDSPSPSAPSSRGRLGDWYASLDRRTRNLAVLAIVVPALFLVRMELKVPGEFRALPIRNADARAEVDGLVAKILVDEGTQVHAGDLVAQLMDRDYRAELRKVNTFLGFMRTEAAEIPGDGQARDPRVLVDEWRAAGDHIRQLEEAEAGWADHAKITALDPDLEPLREQVLKDPLFHHAFHLLPTDIAVVELDRLVIFQRHINLGFVRQLKERLGPAPGGAATFAFCLPFDHPRPPIRWLRSRSDVFVFVSPSNDMRFLDSVVLRPEDITGYPPSAAVSGVVGLVVGFGSNFLNAIHAEDRLILNNGSHRAFALRDLGVTHAPCIIQHVSSRDEFNAVASSELKKDPDLYLTHPRPPVFKDYFDPKLRKVVPVVRKLHQVRVRFEIEETDIPAA